MKQISLLLLFLVFYNCESSKLRGGRNNNARHNSNIELSKQRFLNKAAEKKISRADNSEALFFDEGKRNGSPPNEAPVGRVSSYEELEELFRGKAEPKGTSDRTSTGNEEKPNEKSLAGLGGMEGYKLMQHNSERTNGNQNSSKHHEQENDTNSFIDIQLSEEANTTLPLTTGIDEPPQKNAQSLRSTDCLFGGDQIEPIRTFNDHPHQQARKSPSKLPVPQDTKSEQALQKEAKPHQISNHRQQPTDEERGRRVASIVVICGVVLAILLGFTYIGDFYKSRQSREAARKLELNFGGSQYETDAESSVAPTAKGNDNEWNTIYDTDCIGDACEVISDPWSHTEGERIDFDRSALPSRKRIANYAPRRTPTIYEEDEEYMQIYDQEDASSDVTAHLSRLYSY